MPQSTSSTAADIFIFYFFIDASSAILFFLSIKRITPKIGTNMPTTIMTTNHHLTLAFKSTLAGFESGLTITSVPPPFGIRSF
jgi:hypothetical protein